MRKSVFLIPMAIAAMIPASVATAQQTGGEAELQKMLAGRVAGAPVSCVGLRQLGSSEIIDGTAIVYRTNGSRLYINRPQSGASFLESDDILVTRTIGAQLCKSDAVDMIDRSSRGPKGFVILGDFIPYDRVPPSK